MIGRLRGEIETIDGEILALLERRLELACRVGAGKRKAGLPVLDPAREARVVGRAAAAARRLGLPEEEVRDIFWGVVHLCRTAQREAEGSEAP